MKFSYLLVLLLAFGVVGCSKTQNLPTEKTPDTTIDFLGESLEVPGASIDNTKKMAEQLEF